MLAREFDSLVPENALKWKALQSERGVWNEAMANERLEAQADYYHDVVGACLAAPNCLGATFWDCTDRYSWIDARHGPDDPLLFDEDLAKKPAYFSLLDALDGAR